MSINGGVTTGEPVAYFLKFTTYGAWLHGREPGSVDRAHNEFGTPVSPPNPRREAARRQQMRQLEYTLDQIRRQVVLRTILEVARHRGWTLYAVHVRTTHVHIVVGASGSPEKMLIDFKAWASRRLREALAEDADRYRWTQHGNTRYVWDDRSLADVVEYVLERQGEPMECYDGRVTKSEPEA